MTGKVEVKDFELYLIQLIAETLLDEKLSDSIWSLQVNAYAKLKSRLSQYKSRGYIDELTNAIAYKKSEMIKKAKSKTEIEKILEPKAPRFNGVEFIPDEYSVPEEELIGWSLASLSAPLNEYASKRYFKLFETVFPNVKLGDFAR